VSRVGRLAGAILAETGDRCYLVGNLKRPCDFAAAGFEPPPEPPDALVRPYIPLARSGPLHPAPADRRGDPGLASQPGYFRSGSLAGGARLRAGFW